MMLDSFPLGTWAIAIQLAILVQLAAFFGLLARRVRLEEVRLWSLAWAADALALVSTFISAVSGAPPGLRRVFLVSYLAAKTSYAILLLSGTRHHVRPGLEPSLSPRPLILLIAAWSVLLGLFSPEPRFTYLAQYLMVAGILLVGGIGVLRAPRSRGARWLGWALIVEGSLFLFWAVIRVPILWGAQPLFQTRGVSTFIDAWTELLVALSCLVAIADRTNEQLRHANRDLMQSQERLGRLVDLDPLTGLANRRTLRVALDDARVSGASLIFLDINEFKDINDRFGHVVGDSTLLRTAHILERSFRPEDRIFRWGGDEFIIVAPSLDLDAATVRIHAVRSELAESNGTAPGVQLAVGLAWLEPEGDATATMELADRRMYEDKPRSGS